MYYLPIMKTDKLGFEKFYLFNTNKDVGIIVDAHYNLRKGPDSISGENASWKDKPNYIQKRLAYFLGNKEGILSIKYIYISVCVCVCVCVFDTI